MGRIKLSFFVIIMMLFICGLMGCNNVRKTENSPSTPDTVKPKQTDTASQAMKVLGETASESSADAPAKKEHWENLCADNEEVLFGFKLVDSPKSLLVCISKTQPDYIVYRFGTKDKVELEFPEDKTDSWGKFTYAYYFRGGGAANEGMDLNYLSFENGGYEYQIYQEFTAKDNVTNVGIKITDKETNKETDLKGLSNSIEGSLIDLKENKKIKIETL